MNRIVAFIAALCSMAFAQAQQTQVLCDRILTLRTLVNGEVVSVPCLELGSADRLEISFDDQAKNFHRYVYKVEHCDFNWNKSSRIFTTDYLQSTMQAVPIEDYQESINTTVEYTHYSFVFPNRQMSIKYSGNYRIHIWDDNAKKEIAIVPFRVVEPLTAIGVQGTTNTDIDWNKTHQQLRLSVKPIGTLRPRDSSREIRIVVMQNGRWDNAVINPKAEYITPTELKWERCRELIFPAGNEFRKFEMTNLKIGQMGVDNIKWFAPFYHTTLYPTKAKPNYIYDEDQDGRYYINATDKADDDWEGDYAWVHFILENKPLQNGDVYVYGGLTYNQFSPLNKMLYNPESNAYEASLLLKVGYYNYQYLFVPQGKTQGDTLPFEGNYFQTENEYTVLVYYTPFGGRYDRLVGVSTFKYIPTK